MGDIRMEREMIEALHPAIDVGRSHGSRYERLDEAIFHGTIGLPKCSAISTMLSFGQWLLKNM